MFSGASLSGAIVQGANSSGRNFPARFANGLNSLIRSNPNASITADGSIGRFSIPRTELAAMYQNQTSDPMLALLQNSSRAWTGIGATVTS